MDPITLDVQTADVFMTLTDVMATAIAVMGLMRTDVVSIVSQPGYTTKCILFAICDIVCTRCEHSVVILRITNITS